MILKFFIKNSRKKKRWGWRETERSRKYEGGTGKSEDSVSDFSLGRFWFALDP